MKRIVLKKAGSIDINYNAHYVNFHKGLNIITGDRETGKSTIVEVIDYCFGKSNNDSIPKTITSITLWHFLVCELGEKSFLLARNSKNASKFILTNLNIEKNNFYDVIRNSRIIDWSETNRLLFEKSGLEAETLLDYATKKERRITFRNCISFCIQKDCDVLSKDELFYRMNNENKKRSLNSELPLLCGMVDFTFFKKLDELENYKKEIN